MSATLHTQTLPPAVTGQAITGLRPGPCVPPRCPTAGTLVVPFVPLAWSLGAWLALPRPSQWLLWTIRLGYAIQFTRRPSKFKDIRFTSVKTIDTIVLCAKISPVGEGRFINEAPVAQSSLRFKWEKSKLVCRRSLFSTWSWIRSTRQQASPRSVLSR